MEVLDKYSGQTTDELVNLEGQYTADSIIEAFYEALQQKGAGNLSAEETTVHAILTLDKSVKSGGFQKFFKDSPDYADKIVEYLNSANCERTASIAENATSSNDAEKSKCDSDYKEFAENIPVRLLEFIKNNKAKISL